MKKNSKLDKYGKEAAARCQAEQLSKDPKKAALEKRALDIYARVKKEGLQ